MIKYVLAYLLPCVPLSGFRLFMIFRFSEMPFIFAAEKIGQSPSAGGGIRPPLPFIIPSQQISVFLTDIIKNHITFTIYLGGFLSYSPKIQRFLNIAFALSQIIRQKSVWKSINNISDAFPSCLICNLMYFFLTQYRRIVIMRTHFYRNIIRVSIMILCDKTKCRRI